MNKLLNLARSLVEKGDRFIQEHGPQTFAEAAVPLLEAAQLPSAYNYQELITATFNEDFNSLQQNFSSLEFSDLPLTLARGKFCFIDLYFWRRRPTVIHNHHFAGAFQCLEGVNVDLEMEYLRERELGRFHSMGKLKVKKTHTLKEGDIQSIAPFEKFIHHNHHHADLTVNLCFRTSDFTQGNISNYLFSGLRFEKDPILLQRTERLLKFIQLDPFDFRHCDLTLDDAIHFLLVTDGMNSLNKRLIDVRYYLMDKVEQEAGIDIPQLLKMHDIEFEKMLDAYD
jgi:hypothetical protein